MLHRAGDWKGVNEHIVLLSKRRAQLKQAVGALVKEAMGYVEKAPDMATKVALIETLGAVTSRGAPGGVCWYPKGFTLTPKETAPR